MSRFFLGTALLLLASFSLAQPAPSALTPKGVFYTVTAEGEHSRLQLSRRDGAVTTFIVVPTTDDAAIENHPRLAYDSASEALFVVWHRVSEEGDEIRLAQLAKDGTWSAPMTIDACNTAQRAGLQLEVTHGAVVEGLPAPTFVHLAWWQLGAAEQTPEYALVVFEGATFVSSTVQNLVTFAGVRQAESEEQTEVVAESLHPPLALSRELGGGDVSIVFGAVGSTALTQVRVRPKLVLAEGRLWVPSRGSSGALPRASFASTSGEPVRAFVSRGRVVLFTSDEKFRYVIYENGTWTPTRMIKLDETLTGAELLEDLRHAVDSEAESSGDPSASQE